MKPPTLPTVSNLAHDLLSLNWAGHVELPDNDARWICEQVLALIRAHQEGSPIESSKCEGCNQLSLIIIVTSAGRFCDECIDEMTTRLEEARDLTSE